MKKFKASETKRETYESERIAASQSPLKGNGFCLLSPLNTGKKPMIASSMIDPQRKIGQTKDFDFFFFKDVDGT